MDNNTHSGLWKALWHIIRGRYPSWEVGATQVPLDTVVVQTIKVPLGELDIYKAACIFWKYHLTSPLSLCSYLWYWTILGCKHHIILEHTPSGHIKLLYHLSDTPVSLINHIYSRHPLTSVSPSWWVLKLCPCEQIPGSVSLPSVRRESYSNPNTSFWRSSDWGEDL